jgi:cellobiose-specific phosphotransferase system component IIA
MLQQSYIFGEVRKAPNGNTYAFISIEKVKGRVALLLIHAKNILSTESRVMSLAFEVWEQYKKVE